MKKSATNGSRNSRVTRLRNGMPNAVFGAKEEANFAADCLLALQKRHQPLLVASEGRAVIAPAIAQLARQHVRLGHRQPRALRRP